MGVQLTPGMPASHARCMPARLAAMHSRNAEPGAEASDEDTSKWVGIE